MKTIRRLAAVSSLVWSPLVLALILTFGAVGDAHAKPRKLKRVPAAAMPAADKKTSDRPAGPGDPRINEGAQGRRNATVDAAAAAEGPINDRRP